MNKWNQTRRSVSESLPTSSGGENVQCSKNIDDLIADKPGRMNTEISKHHILFIESSAHKQKRSDSML